MDDDIDSLKEAYKKFDVQQTRSMDTIVENQRTLTTKDVSVKAKPYANGMTPEESFAAAKGYSLRLIAPHLQEEYFAAAMGCSWKEWKESNLS